MRAPLARGFGYRRLLQYLFFALFDLGRDFRTDFADQFIPF